MLLLVPGHQDCIYACHKDADGAYYRDVVLHAILYFMSILTPASPHLELLAAVCVFTAVFGNFHTYSFTTCDSSSPQWSLADLHCLPFL